MLSICMAYLFPHSNPRSLASKPPLMLLHAWLSIAISSLMFYSHALLILLLSASLSPSPLGSLLFHNIVPGVDCNRGFVC